jgi:uncharacterized protein with HEPN domain
MSSKERRLPDWVRDIREAIQNIREDIGALTEEQFLRDGKTVRAVAKSLSDIGEAANQMMSIDPGLEQRNPAIWQHLRKIYAMRNVLTHGYFRIDASVVWETVSNDLPRFESFLVNVES